MPPSIRQVNVYTCQPFAIEWQVVVWDAWFPYLFQELHISSQPSFLRRIQPHYNPPAQTHTHIRMHAHIRAHMPHPLLHKPPALTMALTYAHGPLILTFIFCQPASTKLKKSSRLRQPDSKCVHRSLRLVPTSRSARGTGTAVETDWPPLV